MPDKTKVRLMRTRGVHAVDCCATCSQFGTPEGEEIKNGWGYCALAEYQHEKHNDVRPMPAHTTFVCPSYERFEFGKTALAQGAYYELLKEKP